MGNYAVCSLAFGHYEVTCEAKGFRKYLRKDNTLNVGQTRARLRYHLTDSRILLDLFTEFGDHVAVPRMLLGIRDRVEGHRIQSLAVQAVEITVWIAFLLEFVVAIVLVFVRRQWWRTWTTALLAASGLLFALYAREPVWTGALLQVPILASMVWARGANSRNVA